jgi:hypothetical protein
MKQTAVEWLIEHLNLDETSPNYNKLTTEKAKEMEKEQIIESYCQGCFDISKDENIFPRETSEQYYNQTYKDSEQ